MEKNHNAGRKKAKTEKTESQRAAFWLFSAKSDKTMPDTQVKNKKFEEFVRKVFARISLF